MIWQRGSGARLRGVSESPFARFRSGGGASCLRNRRSGFVVSSVALSLVDPFRRSNRRLCSFWVVMEYAEKEDRLGRDADRRSHEGI